MSGTALVASVLAVLTVAVMAQTAPEQWLYDTFVDRHGMMEARDDQSR